MFVAMDEARKQATPVHREALQLQIEKERSVISNE